MSDEIILFLVSCLVRLGYSLYFDLAPYQIPIIYRKEYNVSFCGLEKLHVFDASKWGNIYQILVENNFISDKTVVQPLEADKEDLLVIHSKKYLGKLKWSVYVSTIAEILPLILVPNCLIQRGYLRPMRYQTGGSILAGKLAMEWGWAINIGGGFHHCSAEKGGGFCPYADISLTIQFLLHSGLGVRKAMIVDLDAHQGNGHEHDFMGRKDVYIMDMYNASIYPRDRAAKKAINCKVELRCGVEDTEYLTKLEKNLKKSLMEFKPDIIIFNAGTDILIDDPLGLMNISDVGIMRRDEMVFRICRSNNIPIVMLTSGGYLKKTARIIANSILNLNELGYLPMKRLRPV